MTDLDTEGDDATVDSRNAEFWNTLCGTHLAQSLGITDNSPESLRRFDEWYFRFYPYLATHIPFHQMDGKDVLEIGLGYGSVAQRIAETGARYNGLDIARGPVDMVNYRVELIGAKGRARVGSILRAPFADASFDYVISIGCFHHTGNLQQAINEAHRALRPGGMLIFMVYNAYSYRRWQANRSQTLRYFLWDWIRWGNPNGASAQERAAYDIDLQGNAAPHTDFVSRHRLRRLCSQFSHFRAQLENIDQEPPFAAYPRDRLLQTAWPRFVGLDIYVQARR